jgi:hypothetical protein
VAALIGAAGLSLQFPGVHNPQPEVWLVAGPYTVALSAVALFAADALAERLGATRPKRLLLAAGSAVALWNVSVRWGHPEDAVAVGLFLYAVLALSRARATRAAWLAGAAAAVQPLVLLALPIVLAVLAPRRWPGFLLRAATPGVVLLGAAALANWSPAIDAVTRQPNSVVVNHPTPWTSLAPHLGDGMVAAGPYRSLAILVAVACALLAGRRWRAARRPRMQREPVPWSPDALAEVLWWVAATLALRSVFEPVMDAYYVWPVLAVALIPAARTWPCLVATSVLTSSLTFASQAAWRSPWGWWGPMVAGLALTLFAARGPLRRRPAPRLRRGQDDRAVLGDGDGVLDVGRAAPVAAADGPAVPVDAVVVAAAGQEPGLDRDDQPGPQPEAAPRGALVGDVGVLVHGPADAVAAEVGVDPVAGRASRRADGGRDVPDPGARDGGGDPRP